MVKALNTKLTYFVLSALILTGSIYGILSGTVFARDFCNDECRAAEAKERESRAKATEAKEVANDLAGQVNQMNEEISRMEATIAETQDLVNGLIGEIGETEAKLNEQQAALANLLVQLHFDGKANTLKLLASSNSLSDFAEKQSRSETIKTQISISAQAVKAAKEKLEEDKARVEASLAVMESQRAEIAKTRNEQARLRNQYEADAANFSADAEEARKAKAKAIADEIAKYNKGGTIVDAGTNSYPWRGRCPQDNLRFITASGYGCQCVSYAGYKVSEVWGFSPSWGDAKEWGVRAMAAGFRVDDNPEPYTVGYSVGGLYGHVVWVESVNGNGTINLSEYNYVEGNYSYRAGVPVSAYRYIHFDK